LSVNLSKTKINLISKHKSADFRLKITDLNLVLDSDDDEITPTNKICDVNSKDTANDSVDVLEDDASNLSVASNESAGSDASAGSIASVGSNSSNAKTRNSQKKTKHGFTLK
jgi:hypothetical protein